jgi:hypothetical protein
MDLFVDRFCNKKKGVRVYIYCAALKKIDLKQIAHKLHKDTSRETLEAHKAA